MKSYLGLIPISARVHKRQNRMTLLCIIIAVFLVTTVFSMADMGIRMEKVKHIEGHGNWHVRFQDISENCAREINSRSDITAMSAYDVINMDMDKEYYIAGKKAALCGIDEPFISDIMSYFTEGSHLHSNNDIILTPNAKDILDVDMGDTITLNTPAGSYDFTVSGFRSDSNRYVNSNGGETTALLVDKNQIGAFMRTEAFREICNANEEHTNPVYYVQFKDSARIIRKALAEIKEQYSLTDANIEQNTIVMGAMGLSDNIYMMSFYLIAAVLFVLILLASVLMISGSMNSNVTQRTKFFGMLRCIGASRQQIIRFVRLEALNWCKTAIPAGILLGIGITWGLCAALRYIVSGDFSDMPVFGVSTIGITCGILVGLLTVLLAAQSPAKRAAKVSPVTAVSGNGENQTNVRHAVNTRFSKVETALGVHHAVSSRKNIILMTGSFALSIILFLSFSVLVELVGYLIPQKSYAPDIDIVSSDRSNSIDRTLKEEIAEIPGVSQVVGRMTCSDIPADFSSPQEQHTIFLISYDEIQLNWLLKDKDLRKGSDLTKVYGDSNYVLTIYDKDVPLKTGDRIWTGDTELEIAGMLKCSPFSNDGRTNGEIIVICSEETFIRMTGESNYAIIEAQLTKAAADEDVNAVRRLTEKNLTEGTYAFRDRRGEADKTLYLAFMLFVYGFLSIIALVTVFNIMNSISMSVSARIGQYGAMRAVGMSGKQITGMIAAEALTYSLSGCIVGCAIGLPLSKLLYDRLITSHYDYYTWSIPILPLIIILLLVLATCAAAIYAPAKRIRNMAITDTINEQ